MTARHTYNLVDLPIVVAGKSGTAEFGVRDRQGRLPFHLGGCLQGGAADHEVLQQGAAGQAVDVTGTLPAMQWMRVAPSEDA